MEIAAICLENAHLVNKANQPFDQIGKIIPALEKGKWRFEEQLFDKATTFHFPDSKIVPAEYIDNENKNIYFALENQALLGQIVLQRSWNHYVYVYDLAVAKNARGRGVGTSLLKRAEAWGKEGGLKGLYLESQDDNLLACRFYQHYGFTIGGVNTMLYQNFEEPYKHQTAVYWYLPFT